MTNVIEAAAANYQNRDTSIFMEFANEQSARKA